MKSVKSIYRVSITEDWTTPYMQEMYGPVLYEDIINTACIFILSEFYFPNKFFCQQQVMRIIYEHDLCVCARANVYPALSHVSLLHCT